MAYDQHVRSAKEIVARCGVVTLSDTRTHETDGSGQLIRRLLTEAGHEVARYALIPDDPGRLASSLDDLLADGNVDVILTNGGTGIAGRDQTIGVVERYITLPLPGFGELFRMLSWEQIGAGAMLSRAAGGVVHAPGGRAKPLFAMPGSTKAVELAMSKLILPEVRHILSELRNGDGSS
jgi:molybdenum cofactor biosynthesis protein B